MKTTIQILTIIAAITGAVAAVDANYLQALPLPEGVSKAIATFIVCCAAIAHILKPVLEKLGAKAVESIGLWLVLFACLICLPSCAAVMSAATGEPIPTTEVQRTDGTGKPFSVATSDVHRAESQPAETAWGLYNAGAAAARAREVITTSGK